MNEFLWWAKTKQSKYTFPLDVFLLPSISESSEMVANSGEKVDDGSSSFSAVDFVNEYRSRVDSLDSLLEELQEFKDFLKEETISIIHKEYSSFIEFSRKLNTITIDQVNSSMPNLIHQMKEFESFIHNLIDRCEAELLTKRLASKQEFLSKKLLDLYQLLRHNIIPKLQSEKERISGSNFSNDDTYIFTPIAEQLDHCSACLKQIGDALLELSEEGAKTESTLQNQHLAVLFEFYEQVEGILKEAEDLFSKQVCATLSYFIKNNCKNKGSDSYRITLVKLMDCMESCTNGKTQVLEQYLKDHVVSNALDTILNMDVVLQCKNNPEQFTKTLIYDKIIENLLNLLDPILDIILCMGNRIQYREVLESNFLNIEDELLGEKQTPDSSNQLHRIVKSYKFATNSILDSIAGHLHSDQCKFLYEYRNVKVFHAMFNQQKAFVEQLIEKFVPNHEAACFREQVQTTLMKKWQTKIYFALVKQQIVKDFESVIAQQKNLTQVTLENMCSTQYSNVTDKLNELIVNYIFNPETTYMDELSNDFGLLFIQIITRYQKWIIEHYIPQVSIVSKNLSQTQESISNQYCALVQRLFAFTQNLNNDIKVETFKGSHAQEIKTALIQSATHRLLFKTENNDIITLSPVLNVIEEKLVMILREVCINVVASSKSSYSWTSTNASNASSYISEVFKSLIQFKNQQGDMNKIFLNDIIQKVVMETCERFKSECVNIMEGYKKTQQSLERLKKKKGGSNKNSTIQDQILRGNFSKFRQCP